jgi:hypothetical protein
MASDDGLQELIRMGPFLGIDQSTNELAMKPGFALSASNVNTAIMKGAMLPERGRTALFDASTFDFGGNTIANITAICQCVGPNNQPGILFQGYAADTVTLCTGYYDYYSFTFTNVTNANPFTQATQFLNVVYTNGGQRFFPGTDNTKLYQWQYQPPIVTYREAVQNTNGISFLWLYAIAIMGFQGSIQQGDILTMNFNIPPEGAFTITYGVGTTVGSPDSTFAELSQNLATAINTYFTTGAGAGYANKITATPYTNFDVALDPGSISTVPAVGVLLSSNAEGNIGSTYTLNVSMNAGATEGFYLVGQTASISPTSGQFYRESGADTTGTAVNLGNMLGGTYFYLFTRITTMPDGSTSETSPLSDAQVASTQPYPPVYDSNFFPAAYDDPLQVNVGGATYGSNSAVTFFTGTTAPHVYQWAGTNEDGSTFSTNVYRASSLQESFQYQFVGNVHNQPPDNEAAFIDTFSDQDISGNAVLDIHRDPPPFVAPIYTTGHIQSYNFGFMVAHQNRMWALVYYNAPITSSQDGVPYIYQQPQIQLWWSNFGRAWEWNIAAQVSLLSSNVVSMQGASSMQGNYVGPNYSAFYGNMPSALVEVGTTLIAHMKRESWVTWGDGSAANPYVCKPIFARGALATCGGVLGEQDGEFFVTESGDLYFYDGSAPAYKDEDVRGALKVSSINPGVSYADLQASCLAYANQTIYWCFPTKGFSLSYDIVSNHWMSTLPYAPASQYAIASIPANPATLGGTIPNEVIAARNSLPTIVDQWFSDPNQDADSGFQLYSWTTPRIDCGKPDFRKWFKLARVFAPKGKGVVTLSLTIDDGEDITHTFSKSFNLADPQRLLTKKFQGDISKILGYYAQLTITVQSAPESFAPIIWGVGVYGSLSDHLLVAEDS